MLVLEPFCCGSAIFSLGGTNFKVGEEGGGTCFRYWVVAKVFSGSGTFSRVGKMKGTQRIKAAFENAMSGLLLRMSTRQVSYCACPPVSLALLIWKRQLALKIVLGHT